MKPSSILRSFRAVDAGIAARDESRRRERHLPVTSLYRWWARRTTAVTNELLRAASIELASDELVVLDPFAGGGVIALSSVLRGHRTIAQEIDPWAALNLATMATPGDPRELADVEQHLATALVQFGDPYITSTSTGDPARMTYTLRVTTAPCPSCATSLRLFPHALVTRTVRTDRRNAPPSTAWFACRAGHVHASALKQHPCPKCQRRVRVADKYTVGRRVTCWSCGEGFALHQLMESGARREPVLVGRTSPSGVLEFAEPTPAELKKIVGRHATTPLGPIPEGTETAVLLRHGYKDFADLYPARQLAALSALLAACDGLSGSKWSQQVARACVIGAAEFAGHATRWDSSYLKPYETLAAHRYTLTTLSAEIDPWGPTGRGTVPRRLAAARRATGWLADEDVPPQVRTRTSSSARRLPARGLTVVTGSSTRIPLPDRSVSLILTDPPYHDDVQYAELASLFRAWNGEPTGRLAGDVTAPAHSGAAGADTFERALTTVFTECRRVVRDDGHLLLSFANRNPRAWIALLAALEAAGWHSVGYDVVHSENETDYAKSGRRACTLDVLLDLAPTRLARPHRPNRHPSTVEEEFCFTVGEHALHVGRLKSGWRERLHADADAHAFLADAAVVSTTSAS